MRPVLIILGHSISLNQRMQNELPLHARNKYFLVRALNFLEQRNRLYLLKYIINEWCLEDLTTASEMEWGNLDISKWTTGLPEQLGLTSAPSP